MNFVGYKQIKGYIFMFYDNLKTACINKNTTISEILTKLGLSKANGTNWKKGQTPSGDVIEKLSDELEVTTDYLIKGKLLDELIPVERQNIFNNMEVTNAYLSLSAEDQLEVQLDILKRSKK